ncbi:MAG: transcription antitermination factor NusB [bacterium]
MGKRRKARELAVELLFMTDVVDENADDSVKNYLRSQKILSDVKEFALKLKDGVIQHKESLDEIISKTAKNWEISRMSIIDRSILRMATFEFLYLKEASVKVIINEAIEVAKEYSTEESGRFINGILDEIMKKGDED